MNFDYARFKQQINLTQYAAHLGYKIDRKKSTRSSIAMTNGADKVIISKRKGIWVYFSVTDDQDNGTIIDFVRGRTGKSAVETAKELCRWLDGEINMPTPVSYKADIQEQGFEPARVERIFKACRPVTYHRYLAGRGLDKAVLTCPRFSGRIYTDRYDNAVFPHYGDDGLCGLELKNADKCFFVRGSEKTLWRSNHHKGDHMLIISEAVIDALSYHKLFHIEDALYAATGGGMSSEQGALIRRYAENTSVLKTIIIITDNDQGGDKLTKRIMAAIGEGGYTGQIIRHSPETCGHDWNDVLQGRILPKS